MTRTRKMRPWQAVAGAWFLLVFAVIWLVCGRCKRNGRSNCVFWAGDQWVKHGGWVGFRPSDFGWLIHCVWSPDLRTWYGFVPVDDLPPYKLIPDMFFVGKVEQERAP